jgi:hypothetical protein
LKSLVIINHDLHSWVEKIKQRLKRKVKRRLDPNGLWPKKENLFKCLF